MAWDIFFGVILSKKYDYIIAWDFIAPIVSGDPVVSGPACNEYLNTWFIWTEMCFQYNTSFSNEIVGEESYNSHLLTVTGVDQYLPELPKTHEQPNSEFKSVL